jgi:GGDEF domain-containing protein
MAEHDGWRARWRVWRVVLGVWLAVCGAWVHAAGPDISRGALYWIDGSARSDVSAVASLPGRMFEPLAPGQTFSLDDAALWVRLEIPPLDGARRWYLQVDFNALDRVELYQPRADGGWNQQQAGDRLPLSQWSLRDRLPVFRLDPAGQPRTVWLRVMNRPVPVSPEITLLDEDSRDARRVRTFVALGAYFGFGALVLFIGLVHARLYADRAFVAYGVYVANMLALQVSFTGLGGLLLWPEWPAGNNGSPALFTLWLTASSIWFLREVCAVSRFHRGFDRLLGLWSLFGWLYPVVYILLLNRPALVTLHAYVFLSGLLGLAVCFWAWRQGERYAGWVGLGLLPVVLTFPFPALRNLGVLPANVLTQYALVLGSLVEIPLLLYILHRRARDYSENRVRLRSIDSTDPLTGLVASPVLGLRLRDALRRARRYGHRCGVLLVELSNHGELVEAGGRELGERALVVAASRLSRVVRDIDTVSRVSERCFAIHVEGPSDAASLADLATHVVAKGLARTPLLPPDLSLRLRVVTLLVPDPALAGLEGEEGDDERCLAVLRKGLERMAADDRRAIRHLGRPEPTV